MYFLSLGNLDIVYLHKILFEKMNIEVNLSREMDGTKSSGEKIKCMEEQYG